MNPSRKLATSAALFALALILVAGAAATQSVVPLFVAWVPLGLVAWVIRRPGPDWEPPPAAQSPAGEGTTPVRDESPPGDEETR